MHPKKTGLKDSHKRGELAILPLDFLVPGGLRALLKKICRGKTDAGRSHGRVFCSLSIRSENTCAVSHLTGRCELLGLSLLSFHFFTHLCFDFSVVQKKVFSCFCFQVSGIDTWEDRAFVHPDGLAL